jgi:hypothetical protein
MRIVLGQSPPVTIQNIASHCWESDGSKTLGNKALFVFRRRYDLNTPKAGRQYQETD